MTCPRYFIFQKIRRHVDHFFFLFFVAALLFLNRLKVGRHGALSSAALTYARHKQMFEGRAIHYCIGGGGGGRGGCVCTDTYESFYSLHPRGLIVSVGCRGHVNRRGRQGDSPPP